MSERRLPAAAYCLIPANATRSAVEKSAAVSRYPYGLLPLKAAQRLYDRNPQWKSA